MNKEKVEAIELLRKEDIKEIIKGIEKNNLKVVFWKDGQKDNKDYDLWFIDDMHIYDYLHFYTKTNLHWTKIFQELTVAIATNPKIKIHHK